MHTKAFSCVVISIKYCTITINTALLLSVLQLCSCILIQNTPSLSTVWLHSDGVLYIVFVHLDIINMSNSIATCSSVLTSLCNCVTNTIIKNCCMITYLIDFVFKVIWGIIDIFDTLTYRIKPFWIMTQHTVITSLWPQIIHCSRGTLYIMTYKIYATKLKGSKKTAMWMVNYHICVHVLSHSVHRCCLQWYTKLTGMLCADFLQNDTLFWCFFTIVIFIIFLALGCLRLFLWKDGLCFSLLLRYIIKSLVFEQQWNAKWAIWSLHIIFKDLSSFISLQLSLTSCSCPLISHFFSCII